MGKFKASLYLLAASTIWGFSFVVNRQAVDVLSPWAYCGFRYLVGGLSMLPLAWVFRRTAARYTLEPGSGRSWLWGAALGGALLFIASGFQLYGIGQTTAGKAGFITVLYLTMVPVLGLLLGQIPRPRLWVGLGIGLVGLAILSLTDGLSLGPGEQLLLLADILWAVHVLVLAHFAPRMPNMWLFIVVQNAVCASLALVAAYATGTMATWPQISSSLSLILWSFMSAGVAFFCQAKGQIKIPASSAALILQAQAPIGALFGVLLLGETMTGRLALGGLLMVAGALLAQRAGPPICRVSLGRSAIACFKRLFAAAFKRKRTAGLRAAILKFGISLFRTGIKP